MVSWDAITKSKNLGGLGLRSSSVMNTCLLLKWWWRLGAETHALWKVVVCSKYNMGGGSWMPHMEGNNRVSKIWSDVIRAMISKPVIHNLYLVNTAIQLGNGQRAQFWLDKWAGEMCLKEEFPRLFSLSTNRME